MKKEDLNPPAIVKTAKSLEEELAQRIKDREQKIVESTMEHARLQGEDLLRARQHLGKRKFAPWLESNFGFSRPTAYKYMRIARNWELICKRRLQMEVLEEVCRTLFGKAKGRTKRSSSPEADSTTIEPEVSRSNEDEPSSVTVRVTKIETAADPTRVAADESTATDSTLQHEQPAMQADIAGDEDDTGSEKETGHETQKEVQQPKPAANDDAVASNPMNALVIPIKNPQVNEYFQGLCDELVDYHRKGSLILDGIFSAPIREMIKDEQPSVTIVLALMQRRVTLRKGQEEWKESKSSDQIKTQEKASRKRK